jgi:hypothetical protein
MTFSHISKEELIRPKDGATAVVGHYWWENEAGEILDYHDASGRAHAQSNRNRDVRSPTRHMPAINLS